MQPAVRPELSSNRESHSSATNCLLSVGSAKDMYSGVLPNFQVRLNQGPPTRVRTLLDDVKVSPIRRPHTDSGSDLWYPTTDDTTMATGYAVFKKLGSPPPPTQSLIACLRILTALICRTLVHRFLRTSTPQPVLPLENR